jgi:hypothetical protein
MTKPRRTALDEAIQHILDGTGSFSMHESDKKMLRILRAARKDKERLDPLLSGPSAVIHKGPCPEVEALLNGVRKRLLDKAAAIKAGRRGGKR